MSVCRTDTCSEWPYGVAVIDARDPVQPQQIDRIYFADTTAWQTILDENMMGMTLPCDSSLFVAVMGTPNEEDHLPGIYQYDITDINNIQLRRFYSVWSYTPELFARRDSLVVAVGHWELHTFILNSGDSLVEKDSLQDLLFHTGDPVDISLSGNTVYLAWSPRTLARGITSVNAANADSIFRIEDFGMPANFNCVTMVDSVGFAGYFHWDLQQLHLKLMDSSIQRPSAYPLERLATRRLPGFPLCP